MITLEQELYISFTKGNQKAFEWIFKSYYSRLCSYANTFIHQAETSEDIVKDIFLSLWEKRESLEIKSSLSGYLFRSTRNACLNYISREKEKNKLLTDQEINLINLQLSQTVGTNNLLENIFEKELQWKIDAAIEELPGQCKEIFKMSRVEDLSYKQIATQLDISENTVKVQIYRALSKLRIALKDYLAILILMIFYHQM